MLSTMLRRLPLACATFLALVGLSTPASAIEFFEYEFEANVGYGPTPVHTGSFTLSYDGSTYALTDIDFTVGTTSFTLADTLLAYSGSTLQIGGVNNGAGRMTNGTDDFAMYLSSSPTFGLRSTIFYYTQAGWSGGGSALGEAAKGTAFTITQVSSVPEPATWLTLILGFGAIGVAMRRRGAQRKPLALA